MKFFKKIYFLLFVLTALEANSQFDDVFYLLRPDTQIYRSSQVSVFGDYLINSSVLTSDFFNKFYSGGYIDTDLKDKVAGKLRDENVAGADINSGFSCMIHPKLKKYSFSIGVKDRSHFDAKFSEDFFRVVMYGNKEYAGKTASLGNLNINLLRYQQAQVGFVWIGPDSSTTRMGIAASFVKGEQNMFIDGQSFDLFTSADGRYIDLDSKIDFMRTDTTKTGLGAFNGIGASFDLFFEVPLKNKYGYSAVRISFNDVGFVNWSDQSISAKSDSTYHFDGYHINNILDLQGNAFSSTNQDSIVKKIFPMKKEKYTTNLPTVFNLNYRTWFSPKIGLSIGVRYLYYSNYSLYFYAQPVCKIGKHFTVVPSLSYGGYGTFSYGLSTSVEFLKGFIVMAGSNNVEGYLSPANNLGQNAFVKLIKRF